MFFWIFFYILASWLVVGLQDAPKTLQDASKTLQDASKSLQDTPKTPPREAKKP